MRRTSPRTHQPATAPQIFENGHSQEQSPGITPENAARAVAQPAELTPENAELLAGYAGHLERSPLSGHSPRTYLGAVRAYLAWLQDAPVDGGPLNDATAKDCGPAAGSGPADGRRLTSCQRNLM